jgi:hypothetical protein
VRREVVESANIALLARFLAPWASFLAARGRAKLKALPDLPDDE